MYSKHDGKRFFCCTCLHGFTKKKGKICREDCKLLQRHQEHSFTMKPQVTEFTQGDDAILKFKNIHKQLNAPFIAYTDIESVLRKRGELNFDRVKTGKETLQKGKNESEIPYQEHEAFSIGHKIISSQHDY